MASSPEIKPSHTGRSPTPLSLEKTASNTPSVELTPSDQHISRLAAEHLQPSPMNLPLSLLASNDLDRTPSAAFAERRLSISPQQLPPSATPLDPLVGGYVSGSEFGDRTTSNDIPSADSCTRQFLELKSLLQIKLSNLSQVSRDSVEEAQTALGDNRPTTMEERRRLIQYLASLLGKSKYILLFCAAENNLSALIAETIVFGEIDIDHPDPNTGDTALHIAMDSAHLDSVRVLIALEANLHQTNFKGETPYHYAKLKNDDAIYALIRER